jgi:cardiolipin synthase (CMP-forming)
MEQVPPANRVLTVPNALSAIRLALIPVFAYVLLFTHANGWAVAILVLSGVSDWADGKIARTLNQSSRLGVLLDPAVDRLYMVTVPVLMSSRCWRATGCWPQRCPCCEVADCRRCR